MWQKYKLTMKSSSIFGANVTPVTALVFVDSRCLHTRQHVVHVLDMLDDTHRRRVTCYLARRRFDSVQGRNHGWKVEGGGKVWVPKGVGCGEFLKTQMLNPAFWWLLAVKFLAFWKLRPRSFFGGRTNTLLVPQPKSWGPVFPGPYGCCAYAHRHTHR